MVGDPRWESGFDEVWDFSGAAEVDISPAEVTTLVSVAHDHETDSGINRCVFITSRDGVKALLRLFERLTRDLPRTYHTVRTREAALEWLGLAPDALEAE